MASPAPKLSLKLLIDTKSEKVLFAEASKEVIDFLFNLLCLPLGTVIWLLNNHGMVGCLKNLYDSVEKLDVIYISDKHKDVLLEPTAPISKISSPNIFGLTPTNTHRPKDMSKFYMCQNHLYVTCDNKTRCPDPYCHNTMYSEVSFVGNKVVQDELPDKSGFVKEVVTYMVMDDLVIEPMSTISSITILNKFNIKDVGTLQEKVVELGKTQGIDMLKASLESKMVLTSVFLKTKTEA